jgi:hypothetical protein
MIVLYHVVVTVQARLSRAFSCGDGTLEKPASFHLSQSQIVTYSLVQFSSSSHSQLEAISRWVLALLGDITERESGKTMREPRLGAATTFRQGLF